MRNAAQPSMVVAYLLSGMVTLLEPASRSLVPFVSTFERGSPKAR